MNLKKKIASKYNKYIVETRCAEDEIEKIYNFYTAFDGYRTPYMCSEITGMPEGMCARVERYLLENRRIGAYYFEANVPPQKYMREYILNKFNDIGKQSRILEIGPGDNPLFDEDEYVNWRGLDKGYIETEYGGIIKFHHFDWGNGRYKNIHEGSWETLSADCKKANYHDEYDLVCGCHSYEHTTQPITALIEASKVLKSEGKLVLFVPDGYSQNESNKDCTHTIYLVPSMIKEFFDVANCFESVEYQPFRPNLDYVITAIKK